MEYGIWTLIPVLFVIAFALKTKRTLEPLIFGTLLTYVITSAARIPSEGVYALSHIATDWMDAFFRVATDYSHQWVFLVCALFGSLITLLGESHGTLGFTRALGKLCGNVKKCAVGKHPKSEKHGNTAQFSEVERSGTQENCGGIGLGCRLRLRPLPVLHRRQSQWVARIDPNAVVVDKNIAENDRFDLFSR